MPLVTSFIFIFHVKESFTRQAPENYLTKKQLILLEFLRVLNAFTYLTFVLVFAGEHK